MAAYAIRRLTELVGDEPEHISHPLGSAPEPHLLQLAILRLSQAECVPLISRLMQSAYQIRVEAYDVIASMYAGIDSDDIGVWQLAEVLRIAATAVNKDAPYD